MEAPLAAAFRIGLPGDVHCVGMCGVVGGALTLQTPRRARAWSLHLAYSGGRIASYAAAGALVAGFGVAGLAKAANLGEHIRQGLLCIT